MKRPFKRDEHKKPKDKTLTDMASFHRLTNWADLWEQWYLDLDTSGRPKYKRIYDFANATGKSPTQRKFLAWYLGPTEPPNEVLAERWPFVKPLDWKKKRETGGWYTDASLKVMTLSIRSRMDALEALREAGNSITLNSVARIEQLAQRLDEAFQGRFFVDGLSMPENYGRARAYLDLHQQLLNLMALAQDLYAKAHGINYADMSGFADLIAASALAAQRSGVKERSKVEVALEQMISMALVKSANYELPLPDDVQKKIIDMAPEPDQPKKKVH